MQSHDLIKHHANKGVNMACWCLILFIFCMAKVFIVLLRFILNLQLSLLWNWNSVRQFICCPFYKWLEWASCWCWIAISGHFQEEAEAGLLLAAILVCHSGHRLRNGTTIETIELGESGSYGPVWKISGKYLPEVWHLVPAIPPTAAWYWRAT